MKIFDDPRVFNYVIMSLYMATAIRWGIAGNKTQMFYWFFALGLTYCVTRKMS